MIKNWIVIIVSCVTVNENHYQNVSIVLGQKEGENEVPHPTFWYIRSHRVELQIAIWQKESYSYINAISICLKVP